MQASGSIMPTPFPTAPIVQKPAPRRHQITHPRIEAKSKYDLAPDYDAVQSAIGTLSSGEAVFLAAMYSFYNDDAGGKMLAQVDAAGLAGISAHLDEPRLRVIADLLVSYAGW